MTSRKRTTQPVATTGTSTVWPVIAWMTSTAGAMSEAPASIARRIGLSCTSPSSAGSATLRIDGCSAAAAHRNEAAIQPISTMWPVVVAVLQGEHGVREVGQQKRDESDEDELEGRDASTGGEEEPDEHAEEEDVEHRISQRHADLEHRGHRVGHQRRHEEGPAQQPRTDRDHERVDHPGTVAAGDPPAHESDDRQRREPDAGEVQDVGNRWERLEAHTTRARPTSSRRPRSASAPPPARSTGAGQRVGG